MNHLHASAEATPVGIGRASSPGELAGGQIIDGKYKLVAQLARGGMSKVWRASHEALRTEVAIKFVDEKLTLDDETRTLTLERFRFEAQISARLGVKTKHVVSVQDAGMHDGTPYLVMELVIGRTLEQEIDGSGPVDPERLANILDQASGALESAHELGIVHRDVKPSNIVIVDTPPGELFVKVGDFGVAKSTRASTAFDAPTETNQGFLVGSPAFMSPEQLRSGEAVDGRTDVWGLGVVAYEALTGKLPFVGVSEADLIVLISTAAPESVTKHRPDLPGSLDGWFARALAKDAHDRFATATEAARAFRAALDEATSPIAPVKRGPALPIVIGVAALVALLGIVPWFIFRSPSETHRAENVTAPSSAPVATAEPTPESTEPTSAATTPIAEAPAPTTTARAATHGVRHPRAKAAATPTAEPAPPQRTQRKEINPSEIQ